MCSSKIEFLGRKNVSSSHMCRLCLSDNKFSVNIFEVPTSKGCSFVDTLNDFIGMDAKRGDDLPEHLCLDCMIQIVRFENISYDLWNTLSYLIRMENELASNLDEKDLYMPEENVKFLFTKESTSLSMKFKEGIKDLNCKQTLSTISFVDGCPENLECEDEDLKIQYCWCNECNEDFISLEDLKLHSEMHKKWHESDPDNINLQNSENQQVMDVFFNRKSTHKDQLRCAKCGRLFRSLRSLSKHIYKHDFKCKRKNNVLKNLESTENTSAIRNLGLKSKKNRLKNKKGKEYDDLTCVSVVTEHSKSHTVLTDHLIDNKKSKPDLKSDGSIKHHFANNQISHNPERVYNVIPMLHYPNITRNTPQTQAENHKNVKSVHFESETFINDDLHVQSSSNTSEKESHSTFICDYCGNSLNDKQMMRNHIVQCHMSFSKQHCPKCFEVFFCDEDLEKHFKSHTSDEKFFCSVCKSGFISREVLINHMKEFHEPERVYFCSVCHNGFKSRFELGIHHSSKVCTKKHFCTKCGRRFMTKSSLNRHINICQLKTVSYKCEICEKTLTTKKNLEFHSRIHSNLKVYQCHICLKLFSQSGSRYSHMRTVHLKIKPHECGICNKKFGYQGGLRNHYRSHSDERPYKCTSCAKAFKRKYELKSHTKRMHFII